MKPRPPLPRQQKISMAVLILLALIGAALWFADPAHRPSGRSRIDWPPPGATKP